MKSTWKRGIITGFVVTVWLFSGFYLFSSLYLHASNLTIRTLTGILGLFILFIGIYFSLRKAKSESKDQDFYFLKALKIGISISLMVAVIVSLFSFIYVYAINPGFTDRMVGETETILHQKGLSSLEIAAKLNTARQSFSAQGQFFQGLIVQLTVPGRDSFFIDIKPDFSYENKRLVMLKKRFVIFTISLSLAFAYGTCYAQSHTCNKLNWLMGEWIGEGTGKPGDGKGSFTFKEDLSGRILIRRNHSEYPPLGDKAGTVHDDLLVVYSDSLGNPSNAIYFDNEGHVINYHLSFTGSVCIFLSQKSDTFPVFKLTYTLTGPDVINIKFEMSQNGGNFITYTEGLCKRRTL